MRMKLYVDSDFEGEHASVVAIDMDLLPPLTDELRPWRIAEAIAEARPLVEDVTERVALSWRAVLEAGLVR